MIQQIQQYINQEMRSSKSFQGYNKDRQNLSTLNNTKILQNRLKKEINNKFIKKDRHDQMHGTLQSSNKRHNSSFLSNNPLTKSSYSLTDSITHKSALKNTLQPLSKPSKILSSKKILSLSFRERYSSMDESLFKTRAQITQRPRPQSQSIRKPPQTFRALPRNCISQQQTLTDRNNKFKLLFKQRNNKYKSASERKIARIDSKIKMLQQKKIYLQSIIPVQKPKIIMQKASPKKYNISYDDFKQKITKMVNQLIKIIELYFNMYEHNNVVGGYFKNVEGYSPKIQSILMIDHIRAKRIENVKEISCLFQVFKPNNDKGQYRMQEDMALFNLLSNFLLKMEKKYAEIVENFKFYENRKRKEENQQLVKTKQKFQKKMGEHEPINRINHFIQNRLRFDQSRREDYMQNLQKGGVVLNLIERSRQLILREKQNAMKNSLLKTGFK